MANPFTGDQALAISTTVKTILRDFLDEKLRAYGGSFRDGVDVKLSDDLEVELPQGRPLISISTRSKTQATYKGHPDGPGTPLRHGNSHQFQINIKVLTDIDSGGGAASSLLSDYVDATLRTNAARAELDALGLTLGERARDLLIERTEEGPDEAKNGLHTNTHVVPIGAVTLDA